MTIYAKNRGLTLKNSIIRTDRAAVYIDRPAEADREYYKVNYSVICGDHLIAAVRTAEQAEALVDAIAAAERAGKSFITVSGGEVVEDQSGGEV